MRLMSLLFLLFVGCSHCRPVAQVRSEELKSSVLVEEYAYGMLINAEGAKYTEIPVKRGSGNVVFKSDGQQEATYSIVLTAAHVLSGPDHGEVLQSDDSLFIVDSIGFKVRTSDYRECEATELVKGDENLNDVASLIVFCDAGRPVKLADKVPLAGEEVEVSAHPHASLEPLITVGIVTGWSPNGFFITSNAIASGSSGGGLFYKGELVGIVVRSDARDFPDKSLSTPLVNVQKCLIDTFKLIGL